MSLTRAANPIWFMNNLTGAPLDDTYYAFFLQNTLPYNFQPVYQDPAGINPWSDPIEFQPSAGLPNNLYFTPGLAYRIEIRQGPTQAAPLIWLVQDFIAPLSSGTIISGTAGQLAYFNGSSLVGGQLGNVLGTATNDNAAIGYDGEVVSKTVLAASSVTIAANTPSDLTSIPLTAGDWDLYGNIISTITGLVTPNALAIWTSTTSATAPDEAYDSIIDISGGLSSVYGCPAPSQRISIAVPTTCYISAYAYAASGTATICGNIWARRAR